MQLLRDKGVGESNIHLNTLGPEKLQGPTSLVLSRMNHSETFARFAMEKNVLATTTLPGLGDMKFTWIDCKTGRMDDHMPKTHRYVFNYKSRVTLPTRRDTLRDVDDRRVTRNRLKLTRVTVQCRPHQPRFGRQTHMMESGRKKSVPSLDLRRVSNVDTKQLERISPKAVDGQAGGSEGPNDVLFLKLTVEELFVIRENPKSLAADVMKANATIEASYPNGRGILSRYRD